MIQLDNRDDTGELRSYVRNFERYVITESVRRTWSRETLDQRYDCLLAEWQAVWQPEGYTFENARAATLFLLRWS